MFPIPASQDLINLCKSWHSGQWSAMYSVSSTGTIHSVDIARALWCELSYVARNADNLGESCAGDADIARRLEKEIDEILEKFPDDD